MHFTSLKALDLEESFTRSDELLMAYTLTSFDQTGKAVALNTGSWGIQETKKNQQFSEKDFQSIQISFPKNGKVVATMVLIEVDDYAKAQKTLAEIRKYHEYIKIPAALAELADVALTPLKYISIGLSAAGVAFLLADRLDNDDVLGQSSTQLTYQQAMLSPVVSTPLTFKNNSPGSSYHYELVYDLRTQTVRIKKGKNPKS